jgi:hypothetical protein
MGVLRDAQSQEVYNGQPQPRVLQEDHIPGQGQKVIDEDNKRRDIK